MIINPKILADELRGTGPIETLGRQIADNPQLRAVVWALQYLCIQPGGWQALLKEFRIDRDSYNYSASRFIDLVEALASGERRHLADEPLREDAVAAICKVTAAHVARVNQGIAETTISKTIYRELDLALCHLVPVPIVGDSRFGKTKAVSTWCDARPGLARLVTVPESTRDFDFFAAIARALGISFNDRTPAPRLKREVEYVLQNSGLFIVFDEAHFLVPTNYHKDTPPRRINWVRCQVIDMGIGCAFFATPQSYKQTLQKFAETTKYNFEQWLGRLAPPIVLADYYDLPELMAVAKVHFPKFPELPMQLICARAMQSEGYLKSMEFTARYASSLAQRDGRDKPNQQDVEAAIERMMPTKAAPPAPEVKPAPATRKVKPAMSAPARSMTPEPALTEP
jgi:hypothetical protein